MEALQKTDQQGALLKSLQAGTNEFYQLVPTSIEKAQEGTKLATLRKDDKKILEACLIAVIADCCEYYGVEWKPNVIVKLIDKILATYYYLNFEEVVMIIQQGVEGERGTGMQNLKPSHIMDWIGEYDQERTEYYVDKNLSHKEPYEKQLIEMEKKDKEREVKKLKDEIIRQDNYVKAKEIVNDRQAKRME